jgi:hypothetical protein
MRVRILLDECLPAEFVEELKGHEVSTVRQEGWSGLENGALLRLAATRFSVFITVDKRIQVTQKLPEGLAVITLRAWTNRIESLRPLVPRVLELLDAICPGTFETVWPATTGCGEPVRLWEFELHPSLGLAAGPDVFHSTPTP